jgi:predicted glycoside hydrolase/deacetylase ChbG (UPF0249 family)
VNRAIIEAAEKGVLSSASLMLNGAAVEDAVEKARACPSLGVGLHLNVVRGRPLSDPGQVPGLVDEEGRFFNSMGTLLWRSVRGVLSASEIHHEYRLQLRAAQRFGITPTHFDGEKHSHLLLPEATLALKRLADESGIRKARIIGEAALNRKLRAAGIRLDGSLGQRAKLLLLEHRSRGARRLLEGLRSTQASFGVLVSGAEGFSEGARVLRAILDLASPASVEWMFHLSYPFDPDEPGFQREFGSFFLTDARTRELEFLCSEEVRQALAGSREKLVSYRDL